MTTTENIGWEYQNWATADLVREDEAQAWRLAELDESPADDIGEQFTIENGMALIADCLVEIRAELAKRRALYRSDYAPKVGRIERTDIFRFVKERITIEMLCQRYGPIVTPRGRDLWGLCPLPDHHEKTPSFHITPSKQQWNCFGCNRGGDLFHLAMYYFQEPSVIEAAKRLCRDFGIAPPEVNGKPKPPVYTIKRPDGTVATLNARVKR